MDTREAVGRWAEDNGEIEALTLKYRHGMRSATSHSSPQHHHLPVSTQPASHRQPKRRKPTCLASPTAIAVCALLATSLPSATAQTCIPLTTSAVCPSFNASSISTSAALVGLYPFLATVTDTASFDSGLETYIANGFTQLRYQTLLGCANLDADNTTAFYARYTASVLCNGVVQNSAQACGLTGNAARPLCADTCAAYAQSEEQIISSDVCGTASAGALTQVRADFTNCALPADSLSGSCITGAQNEPDNCGFFANLGGLCSYCGASSPNSTDSCCVFSNSTTRCEGVVLPIIASSSLQPVTVTATPGATSSPTAGAGGVAAAAPDRGLTGGQIAGIVVGSVLGALILLALLIGGLLLLKRRKGRSPSTSVFDQPTNARHQPPMATNDGARDPDRGGGGGGGMAMLGGGRVTRLAAIEESDSSDHPKPAPGYSGRRKSASDEEEIPGSRQMLGLAPPPKRSGSLSSTSQLATPSGGGAFEATSPSSDHEHDSSPESQQSERLDFFKDYYSQDTIHAGDAVATLWAYEPRAADEFHLERGDLIKVLGIWDDGWATGVRLRQHAEDWRPEQKLQRDSGMSGSPTTAASPAQEEEGEVKAFPLVCVCLPQHWQKTIDGDSTEGSREPDFSELP